MLGNAIMQSSFQKHAVEIPIDGEAYAAKLEELIKTSKFQKTEKKLGESAVDIKDSYSL